MSPLTAVNETVMELPSDQDHTGRTFGGQGRVAELLTGVIEAGR